MDTPNTGIPFVPETTEDPAAGLNLALLVIDALLQSAVIDMDLTAPPGSPSDGDLHIVGGSATGAWDGQDNNLARYVAEGDFWQFYTAGTQVHLVLNKDDGGLYKFVSGSWVLAAGLSDAPSDGTGYVRKDGSWVAESTGGGGASIGVQCLSDTASTTDSDPGAGNLRWDNATQADATELFVSDDTVDSASLTGVWATLVAGGLAYLQHATDQDTWQIWEITGVTDDTGYAKLAVTLLAKGDDFGDDAPILLTLQQGAPAAGLSTGVPMLVEPTATRDMDPGDAGYYHRFTYAGAKTATFDDGDGFAAEQEFHVTNRAASGNLTLTAAGTMTLNPPKGGTLVLEPGDTVTVKMVDTDEADVFGSTVAA